MKKGVAPSESQEILATAEHPPGGAGTPYGTTPTQESLPLREIPKSAWQRIMGLGMPRRYFVAMMAFLGFCNIYAMRVNLSIGVLSMTSNRTITRNGSKIFIPKEFDWTPLETGVILSSFFYGYIITQLPGGWFAAKHGGRFVFGMGVLGTAFLTLLTPPLAHMGKEALIVVRILEGICEGVTYPAIHAVWSHWAPPLEKTKLATIAFAGSYFGTVVSMPISAALGEYWGWPSIFYVFGLLAMMWCMLWFKTVSETPAEDRHIDRDEITYIHQSIGFTWEQTKDIKPPLREILTSKAVWAIVVAHFCENWGFYTMLTHLPRFLEQTLNDSITKAGFTAALPYLVMGIIVVSGGQIADYLRDKRNWPTVTVRRLFCCGAFLSQTVFIILTAHAGVGWLVVTFITIAIGLGGFAWSGFSVNHLDIAPQYASMLMGMSNTFATIPGIIGPPLVGFITTASAEESMDQIVWKWRFVFYIAAGVYAFGAVVYSLWSSGEVQYWAVIDGGYMSRLDDLNERAETAADPRVAGQ